MEQTIPSFSYSEFIPAKPRKRRKNRVQQQQRFSTFILLQRLRDEMLQDQWFSQCQSIVRECLTTMSFESPSVLCLGLGSPSTSLISRAQLAFLAEICNSLNIDLANVSIYDPAFTPEDLELFEQLHFQVLSENKNAGYPLEESTICYMPHCDMELYENLLRANWSKGRILRLVLVANRLEEYLENHPHHKLQDGVPCLLNLAPELECHPFPPSRSWPTAFNNTSVQYVRLPITLSGNWFSKPEDQPQSRSGPVTAV